MKTYLEFLLESQKILIKAKNLSLEEWYENEVASGRNVMWYDPFSELSDYFLTIIKKKYQNDIDSGEEYELHIPKSKIKSQKFKIEPEIQKEKDGGIIVYHSSDELSHLKKCDFRLEYSKDENLFGHAIYFSTSSQIYSSLFGKYMCKYLICPDKPILNMNEKLSQKNAKKLLDEYNIMFKKNNSLSILDRVNCYGDFFEEIGGELWNENKNFKLFIQEHMGYNSFKYYQTEMTDFKHSKGVYGLSFGIYNPKNIKFLDGPI